MARKPAPIAVFERRPPTMSIRRREGQVLARAIECICEAAPRARESESYRGLTGAYFGILGAPPAKIGDPTDPLHARTIRPAKRVAMPLAQDPTSRTALAGSPVEKWLRRSRGWLVFLAAVEGTKTLPADVFLGRDVLTSCAITFCERWPRNAERLIDRIHGQANLARKLWPDKPKPGDIVDGVRVGGPARGAVRCGLCNGSIFGGVTDPMVRFKGTPYHQRPCYHTVWQRDRARRRYAQEAVSDRGKERIPHGRHGVGEIDPD